MRESLRWKTLVPRVGYTGYTVYRVPVPGTFVYPYLALALASCVLYILLYLRVPYFVYRKLAREPSLPSACATWAKITKSYMLLIVRTCVL